MIAVAAKGFGYVFNVFPQALLIQCLDLHIEPAILTAEYNGIGGGIGEGRGKAKVPAGKGIYTGSIDDQGQAIGWNGKGWPFLTRKIVVGGPSATVMITIRPQGGISGEVGPGDVVDVELAQKAGRIRHFLPYLLALLVDVGDLIIDEDLE